MARSAGGGSRLGLKPNGKKISFSEHVFYKLRDGRISEVRSLIDRDAVARQLAE
ncbi:ester cyclase [Hyphomicrobium sp. 99]|uniref:ester cyclase n=1 Tax=Hyphomicrobium sp. 99 TaxID=1163419 RepID=UPI001FD95E54|nr:ester cyclase [Hyphomicrobium sp. 99]